MFVYFKTPDVGTQGQNEGGRLVGGEVRAREGFFFTFFFYNHVFVVKVQETAWSASYGVNKTLIPTTARFTPSWEKSNPSNPEHTLPPSST